jgi:hypothetical protein
MSTKCSVCDGGKRRGLGASGCTKEDELAGQRDWETSIEYIQPQISPSWLHESLEVRSRDEGCRCGDGMGLLDSTLRPDN